MRYVLGINSAYHESAACLLQDGVPVNFSLHPYYPSRIGREHFPVHPCADLGAALEAAARIREVIRQSGRASMLFIGLPDESHDQEPAARRAQFARYAERFHRFNITQQPSPPGTPLAKISLD